MTTIVHRYSSYLLTVLALFLLSLQCLPHAQAETEEDGRLWGSLYLQGKLAGDQWYWSMDTHPRWRDEGRTFDQLILRPAVFYKWNPQTSVWLGFDTVVNHPAGQSNFREHRLWEQVQYQFAPMTWGPLGTVNLTSRTRFEQRRREDVAELGHRLRQMWRASVPSSLHASLNWVVFDELFINLNETDWGVRRGIDQNRLFLGVNWKWDDRTNMDVGYLNQLINTRTVDRENHVLMTTLRINF